MNSVKGRRMSAEVKEQIRDLYSNKNMSVKYISDLTGFTDMAIRNCLKSLGVYAPQSKGWQKGKKRDGNRGKAVEQKRVESIEVEKEPKQEVSLEGKEDLTSLINAEREKEINHSTKKHMSDLDKHIILELRKYGSKLKDIAAITGFKESSICIFLKKCNMATEISKEFTPSNIPKEKSTKSVEVKALAKEPDITQKKENKVIQKATEFMVGAQKSKVFENEDQKPKVQVPIQKSKVTATVSEQQILESQSAFKEPMHVGSTKESSSKGLRRHVKVSSLDTLDKFLDGMAKEDKVALDADKKPRKKTSSNKPKKSATANKPKKKKSSEGTTKEGITSKETKMGRPRGSVSKQEKIAYCNMMYGVGNWRFMTRDELLEALRNELG